MSDVADNSGLSLPTPLLRTARLRPFTAADTNAIFALQSNPRVLRDWDAPPWRERAQAECFIVRCQQMAQAGSLLGGQG